MSRTGKKPVTVPSGVTASIADGQLSVKGPKGNLTQELRWLLAVSFDEEQQQESQKQHQRQQAAKRKPKVAGPVHSRSGR